MGRDHETPPRLGRRGFIQTSSAAAVIGAAGGAVAGAIVEGALASSTLSWDELRGGPDAPMALWLVRPEDALVVDGELSLVVTTPQGVFRRPAGTVRIGPGHTRLEVTLDYPFAASVYGEYLYQAVVRVDGDRLVTDKPARYAVEPFVWFS